eukprot:4073879-Prymnesium_polylepis.1
MADTLASAPASSAVMLSSVPHDPPRYVTGAPLQWAGHVPSPRRPQHKQHQPGAAPHHAADDGAVPSARVAPATSPRAGTAAALPDCVWCSSPCAKAASLCRGQGPAAAKARRRHVSSASRRRRHRRPHPVDLRATCGVLRLVIVLSLERDGAIARRCGRRSRAWCRSSYASIRRAAADILPNHSSSLKARAVRMASGAARGAMANRDFTLYP